MAEAVYHRPIQIGRRGVIFSAALQARAREGDRRLGFRVARLTEGLARRSWLDAGVGIGGGDNFDAGQLLNPGAREGDRRLGFRVARLTEGCCRDDLGLAPGVTDNGEGRRILQGKCRAGELGLERKEI
jgi:hypothetical protein